MKMFINRKHTATHTLSLIASLALAFTSCVQLGEEQEGAYGYLTISGFDVDVQVEQLLPTKTGETKVSIENIEGYPENLSGLTVTVTDSKGVVHTWEGEALSLPSGPYTVNAELNSNGFGAPWLQGTASGTLGNTTETVALSLSLMNSVMKVTNGMPEHVDGSKLITISAGNSSLDTSYGIYVFVPSGQILSVSGYNTAGEQFVKEVGSLNKNMAYDVKLSTSESLLPTLTLSEQQFAWGDRIFITTPATFTGSLSDENKEKLVYEATSSDDWSSPTSAVDGVIKGLTPGQPYKVRARIGGLASNPITLTPTELSTTVYHTDTNGDADGGDLDGTDVKTTFKSPDAKVTALEPKWSFALYKTADVENNQVKDNATPLRTYDGLYSDGSLLTAANDWPYLPKGDYKLVATATLKDGATVSSMSDIEVEAPEFTPTVSLGNTSYTSYDKYAGPNAGNGISILINGNKDQGTIGANDCQPETLYSPSVVIGGIHENLLKNPNYKKSIEFYLDAGTENAKTNRYSNPEMSNNTYTGGKFTSLSWGSHTLTASFTFDGISATFNGSAKTHHITGLPYTATPPTNDKWTSNQQGGLNYVRWETNYVQLEGISIKQSIKSSEFHTPSGISVNFNINVDMRSYAVWPGKAIAELSCAVSGNEVIRQDGPSVGAYGDKTQNYELSGTGTLQDSAPYVEIANNYTMSAAYINIYSVNLVYNK